MVLLNALRSAGRTQPIATSTLERTLNKWDVLLYGIASTVGSGVYVITGKAAVEYAGPAVVVSFLLASTAALFNSFCYAEFACLVPTSGSAYAFTYATIGEAAAIFVGWNLILEYLVSASAVARGWADYVVEGLRLAGFKWEYLDTFSYSDLPSEVSVSYLAPVVCLLCTGIMLFGAAASTRLNMVVTIINMVALLLLVIIGAFSVNPANWTPFLLPDTFATLTPTPTADAAHHLHHLATKTPARALPSLTPALHATHLTPTLLATPTVVAVTPTPLLHTTHQRLVNIIESESAPHSLPSASVPAASAVSHTLTARSAPAPKSQPPTPTPVLHPHSSRTHTIVPGSRIHSKVTETHTAEEVHRTHGGIKGVFRAAGIVFFSYIGFDAVTTLAGEAKKPHRDVPFGVMGTVVVATTIYVAVAMTVTGIVDTHALARNPDSSLYKSFVKAAMSTALEVAGHPTAATVVSALCVSAMTATTLTTLMGMTRILVAVAEDGLIPPAFAWQNKSGAPWFNIVAVGVLSALLAGLFGVDVITETVSLATLLAFATVSGAVLFLRCSARFNPAAVDVMGRLRAAGRLHPCPWPFGHRALFDCCGVVVADDGAAVALTVDAPGGDGRGDGAAAGGGDNYAVNVSAPRVVVMRPNSRVMGSAPLGFLGDLWMSMSDSSFSSSVRRHIGVPLLVLSAVAYAFFLRIQVGSFFPNNEGADEALTVAMGVVLVIVTLVLMVAVPPHVPVTFVGAQGSRSDPEDAVADLKANPAPFDPSAPLIVEESNVLRTPLIPILPILSVMVNVALIASLPWQALIRLVAWTVVGVICYVFYGAPRVTARRARETASVYA